MREQVRVAHRDEHVAGTHVGLVDRQFGRAQQVERVAVGVDVRALDAPPRAREPHRENRHQHRGCDGRDISRRQHRQRGGGGDHARTPQAKGHRRGREAGEWERS